MAFIFGNEAEFASDGTVESIAAASIGSSKCVITFQDTANGRSGLAPVGIIDGSGITFGDEPNIFADGVEGSAVATIDLNKIVVCYNDRNDSNHGKAKVGIVSGTSISFGSEVEFLNGTISYVSIAVLSDTKFVIAYVDGADGSHGTAKIGTVSGTTVSFGSETEFLNQTSAGWVSVTTLDEDKFVVAYNDGNDSSHGTAKIGTVSDTTISFGSEEEFLSAGSATYISTTMLDSSKFVVAYNDGGDSGHGTAKIGTVDGTTIVFGDETEFISAGTNGATFVDTDTLSSTQFVVAFNEDVEGSDDGGIRIGNVSGTTITFDDQIDYLDGKAQYNAVVALDALNFVVAYQDGADSNHGTAKIGTSPLDITQITTSGDLYIYGLDMSQASGDLFIHGYTNHSASGDLFVEGCIAVDASGDLYVYGYDNNTASGDLFVHGYDTPTASGDLFIEGLTYTTVSGDKSLFMNGHNIVSTFGDLFICGPKLISTSGDLFSQGFNSLSASSNLFMSSPEQITTLEGPPRVDAWGRNSYGEIDVPAPNTDFIAVAGGNKYSLGLRANGSIVAWGLNNHGQCNVPAPNMAFVAVAAGGEHSLGLKTDGSIVVWGWNDEGQCSVPAPNSNFVAVAAGGWHSLGLKDDGSIEAWGWNNHGQCNVPSPNSDFVAIVASYAHSLGLKADGSIVAWGNNTYGQINVPAPNTNFMAVAGGSYHGLGLKVDGSIVAWGRNTDGQLNIPAPNTDFVELAGGLEHSLGRKIDGSIVAWGDNNYGQCDVLIPNTNFIAVAAGYYHSMSIKLPDISPHLFIEGMLSSTTSGNLFIDGHIDSSGVPSPSLFIHGYDIISSSGDSFIYGFDISTLSGNLFVRGVENTDDLPMRIIHRLTSIHDYHPQLISTFFAAPVVVNIEVWDVGDGQNTKLTITNSGCYQIGNTNKWAWSTEYLPRSYHKKYHYYFRMTSNENEQEYGEFIITVPEGGRWSYPD